MVLTVIDIHLILSENPQVPRNSEQNQYSETISLALAHVGAGDIVSEYWFC